MMMAQLHDIPKYGFGTAFEIELESDTAQSGSTCTMFINREQDTRITASQFKELISRAIALGCRHFDCAPLYGTQQLVGRALSESMGSGGGIPRQQFFITSKLPPNMMRQENIVRSVSRSINELQCNYLDLLLIHAPFSTKYISDNYIYPTDDDGNLLLDEQENLLENAWRKLVQLKRDGYTRYIGLSNVNLEQLERLNGIHQVDVVQNEYHIYNQNKEMFDHCEELDVHFEAYAAFGSPIKARRDGKPCFSTDPVVRRVAECNGITVSQANIQWIHRQPLSYVVRCDNIEQLEENFMAIDHICLPLNDLIDMDSLNRNIRIYYFDEHKGLDKHREYPFKKPPFAQDPPRLTTTKVQTSIAEWQVAGAFENYAIEPDGRVSGAGFHHSHQSRPSSTRDSAVQNIEDSNPYRQAMLSSTSTTSHTRSAIATGAWPRLAPEGSKHGDHNHNYHRHRDQQQQRRSDESSKVMNTDSESGDSGAYRKEAPKQTQQLSVSVKVFRNPFDLPYENMPVTRPTRPKPTLATRPTPTHMLTRTFANRRNPSEAQRETSRTTTPTSGATGGFAMPSFPNRK